MRNFVAFLLGAILFCSCQSYKVKKEAEQKARELLTALKNGDHATAANIYPGIAKFEYVYKSTEAKVMKVTYRDGIATVVMHNKFTNLMGASFDRDIKLFFKKEGERLVLFDSKGLTDIAGSKYYQFGLNTGCFFPGDTTDQTGLEALGRADTLLIDKAVEVLRILKDEITVTNVHWQTSYYTNSANGGAIVRNNSTFSVPRLKYKVFYYDRAGNEVTQDDGYVSYETLQPGDSKAFTFYTSYVGNASIAKVKLDFDDELVLKYLRDKTWTGTEWSEYSRRGPSVPLAAPEPAPGS